MSNILKQLSLYGDVHTTLSGWFSPVHLNSSAMKKDKHGDKEFRKSIFIQLSDKSGIRQESVALHSDELFPGV